MGDDLAAELHAFHDIEAIKQLKARYVRLVDAQDWAGWANEVLHEDFHFDSEAGVQEGRDEVVAMVRGALTGGSTVHHVYNPEITLTGPDTAEATWPMEDWVRLDVGGTPRAFHGCGHYREQYVRTNEGWRIRRSVLTRQRVDPIEGG